LHLVCATLHISEVDGCLNKRARSHRGGESDDRVDPPSHARRGRTNKKDSVAARAVNNNKVGIEIGPNGLRGAPRSALMAPQEGAIGKGEGNWNPPWTDRWLNEENRSGVTQEGPEKNSLKKRQTSGRPIRIARSQESRGGGREGASTLSGRLAGKWGMRVIRKKS